MGLTKNFLVDSIIAIVGKVVKYKERRKKKEERRKKKEERRKEGKKERRKERKKEERRIGRYHSYFIYVFVPPFLFESRRAFAELHRYLFKPKVKERLQKRTKTRE